VDKKPVDGLVIVDKPAGLTSHDVVSRVRRIAGTRRVGHAGTLDPMATGVLVLGINRGTRLLHYLVGADKTYEATIRLGVQTTTEDAEGEVTHIVAAAAVDPQAIAAGVERLRGPIMQVPSAVSAIKVDGKRSYARVRAGENVELPARPVTINSFTWTNQREEELPDGTVVTDIDVKIACSSGTYIRALARDLGEVLGVGGHLTRLRRTQVGDYRIDQARTLTQLESETTPLTLGEAARQLFPGRQLTASEVVDLGYGKWIVRSETDPMGDKENPVAGYSEAGDLIALLAMADDQYRPVVVFAPA